VRSPSASPLFCISDFELKTLRTFRHLAIAGRKGHVATFDWQSGRVHSEIQLGETVRAIRWLHDESFFAVAQKKYVYIYDKDGLEVHQLRQHIEVNQMEFLPYHFLLATIVSLSPEFVCLFGLAHLSPISSQGNPGYLKYHDTSTGQLVAEHRTKLGSCDVMAQNTHNAFIHLGHQNGQSILTRCSLTLPCTHSQRLHHRYRNIMVTISISSSSQTPRSQFTSLFNRDRSFDDGSPNGHYWD